MSGDHYDYEDGSSVMFGVILICYVHVSVRDLGIVQQFVLRVNSSLFCVFISGKGPKTLFGKWNWRESVLREDS